ncbi:hypothetical protein RHSIM_Rhsim10G0024500 [Rhododendron simsii]|uniref:Uncharacterized protein n=1 Tax=Rhododendron simsii TaxID=118357 RepID=A0A834LAA5_RHOSS|nr:hypothetical protein RHSIM_Rhsim10G0024500 [Rhododendron simsii]
MDEGKKSSLEARLIITPNHERRDHEESGGGGGGSWFIIREEILEEGKKQVGLAGPLIAVSLLQYCLEVISIMFVGHLGELPLSSASLATSFASVSGFSVLYSSSFLMKNSIHPIKSKSLSTCWMVYQISVGLGGAISTRVSNEMGAGRPQGARLALCVMVVVAVVAGAVVGTGTILVRHVWGKLYSNEEEVISYVAKMMPLLALSDFLDGFQCVLSGAARGCGWQNLCAFINLGAYYVVAIPSAVLFAFVLHIGGMARKAIDRVQKTSMDC